MRSRLIVLVKMEAEGLEGWGEIVAGEEPLYSYETVGTALHVVRDYFAPAVLQAPLSGLSELADRLAPFRGHPMAAPAWSSPRHLIAHYHLYFHYIISSTIILLLNNNKYYLFLYTFLSTEPAASATLAQSLYRRADRLIATHDAASLSGPLGLAHGWCLLDASRGALVLCGNKCCSTSKTGEPAGNGAALRSDGPIEPSVRGAADERAPPDRGDRAPASSPGSRRALRDELRPGAVAPDRSREDGGGGSRGVGRDRRRRGTPLQLRNGRDGPARRARLLRARGPAGAALGPVRARGSARALPGPPDGPRRPGALLRRPDREGEG